MAPPPDRDSFQNHDNKLAGVSLAGAILLHAAIIPALLLLPAADFSSQPSPPTPPAAPQAADSPADMPAIVILPEAPTPDPIPTLKPKPKPAPPPLASILTDPQPDNARPDRADFQSANDTTASSSGPATPDGIPLPNSQGDPSRPQTSSVSSSKWRDGALSGQPATNPGSPSQSTPSPKSPASPSQPAPNSKPAQTAPPANPSGVFDPLLATNSNPSSPPKPQQNPSPDKSPSQPVPTPGNASQPSTASQPNPTPGKSQDATPGKPNPSDPSPASSPKSPDPSRQDLAKSSPANSPSEFGPESKSVLDDLAHVARTLNLPDPTKSPSPAPDSSPDTLKPTPNPQPATSRNDNLPKPDPAQQPNSPPSPDSRRSPNPAQTASRTPPPVHDPAFPGGKPGAYVPEKNANNRRGSITRHGDNAVDSVKTPRGAYENAVYKAIGQRWQRECFDRRDLIVPGSLVIRIIINPDGSVARATRVSMDNCSEIQHGFTIRAIKDADIPAMPPQLRKELDNGPLEQTFTFYF